MPDEEFGAGLKLPVQGNTQPLAMESVIVFAVIEFLMNAAADFKMKIVAPFLLSSLALII